MLKPVLAIATLALSSTAFAAGFTGLVRCQTVEAKPSAIELRLREGKIVRYSEKLIAKAAKGSEFENFGSRQADDWFEYTNSVVSRNGAAILIAGTTADEFQIGVNKDLKTGFYNYRDIGSGNGNSRTAMTCAAKQSP